ncbi:MAG: hypothetical protein V1897_05995 [Pseudomonadota bacterium]
MTIPASIAGAHPLPVAMPGPTRQTKAGASSSLSYTKALLILPELRYALRLWLSIRNGKPAKARDSSHLHLDTRNYKDIVCAVQIEALSALIKKRPNEHLTKCLGIRKLRGVRVGSLQP